MKMLDGGMVLIMQKLYDMEKFEYSVIEWCKDKNSQEPHGVIIQVDNGDTQYLTIEQYELFQKNRNER